MLKRTLPKLALLLGALIVLGVLIGLLITSAWQPIHQGQLFTSTVYAYRQWQSTGFYLQPGDQVDIRASGSWMYSPVAGLHGAEGGEPAPPNYPVSFYPC